MTLEVDLFSYTYVFLSEKRLLGEKRIEGAVAGDRFDKL